MISLLLWKRESRDLPRRTWHSVDGDWLLSLSFALTRRIRRRRPRPRPSLSVSSAAAVAAPGLSIRGLN